MPLIYQSTSCLHAFCTRAAAKCRRRRSMLPGRFSCILNDKAACFCRCSRQKCRSFSFDYFICRYDRESAIYFITRHKYGGRYTYSRPSLRHALFRSSSAAAQRHIAQFTKIDIGYQPPAFFGYYTPCFDAIFDEVCAHVSASIIRVEEETPGRVNDPSIDRRAFIFISFTGDKPAPMTLPIHALVRRFSALMSPTGSAVAYVTILCSLAQPNYDAIE